LGLFCHYGFVFLPYFIKIQRNCDTYLK
jgi:hypothetical protein